jgi:hypothetical protein
MLDLNSASMVYIEAIHPDKPGVARPLINAAGGAL